MEKTYKTNKHQIRIRQNWVEIDKVIEERNDWPILLVIISFFLLWNLYDVLVNHDYTMRKFVRITLTIAFFYIYFVRAFKVLFLDYWFNRFKISKIKSIEVLESENILETPIRINIGNRRKILHFRKDEEHLDNFLNDMKDLLPENKVFISG